MAVKTAERSFNSPSPDIEADWAALPPRLRTLLSPWRSDDPGYGAIQFQVGNQLATLDVALIEAASNGDLEAACDFILAEVRAYAEGQLLDRLALIA